ncbi:hypothetical protein ACSX1A_16345 [Pontibacter sp. MBLB2868]|uniref:hypothetical protein n=1 Tax=Pontibacter sp. MBLB2868 TaxID=3451555 RepID=UPI003F74B963
MVLPEMRTSGLSEAERCFEILVEFVKNYHVQNLLLDSSQAEVEVGEASYNALIYNVSMQLKETRLKKVARVVSSNVKLEEMAILVQGQVLENNPATYQIQNFSNRDMALKWLTEPAYIS